MARNPVNIDRDLDALYAKLPTLDCKGLCWRGCSVIPMSVRERERAELALGERVVSTLPNLRCSALTVDRKCAIYEHRPLICRLWGLVEGMPCEHGCKPDPGYLSDEEGKHLLAEALHIGGNPGNALEQIRLATGG